MSALLQQLERIARDLGSSKRSNDTKEPLRRLELLLEMEGLLPDLIKTLVVVKRLSGKRLGRPPKAQISSDDESDGVSIEKIQRLVADARNLSVLYLKSQRRTAQIALARHMAMYLARRLTPYSFPDIGMCFGKRDHTTVLHAVRRIEADIVTDSNLRRELVDLETRLGSRPKRKLKPRSKGHGPAAVQVLQ